MKLLKGPVEMLGAVLGVKFTKSRILQITQTIYLLSFVIKGLIMSEL